MSGYTPDEARNTTKLTLRLKPEVADEIRTLAEAWGCHMSEVVALAVEALRKKTTRPAKNLVDVQPPHARRYP